MKLDHYNYQKANRLDAKRRADNLWTQSQLVLAKACIIDSGTKISCRPAYHT